MEDSVLNTGHELFHSITNPMCYVLLFPHFADEEIEAQACELTRATVSKGGESVNDDKV